MSCIITPNVDVNKVIDIVNIKAYGIKINSCNKYIDGAYH